MPSGWLRQLLDQYFEFLNQALSLNHMPVVAAIFRFWFLYSRANFGIFRIPNAHQIFGKPNRNPKVHLEILVHKTLHVDPENLGQK